MGARSGIACLGSFMVHYCPWTSPPPSQLGSGIVSMPEGNGYGLLSSGLHGSRRDGGDGP
jgi:hypothetical protein